MNVYFGLEYTDKTICGNTKEVDRDDDLIIVEIPRSESIEDVEEYILLLQIHPSQTSLLFDDYGFFSEKGKCYLYHDMICVFKIIGGDEQQKRMFLLQVDEELIAIDASNERNYIIGKHNEMLVKKWALSYEIGIEFILL